MSDAHLSYAVTYPKGNREDACPAHFGQETAMQMNLPIFWTKTPRPACIIVSEHQVCCRATSSVVSSRAVFNFGGEEGFCPCPAQLGFRSILWTRALHNLSFCTVVIPVIIGVSGRSPITYRYCQRLNATLSYFKRAIFL